MRVTALRAHEGFMPKPGSIVVNCANFFNPQNGLKCIILVVLDINFGERI